MKKIADTFNRIYDYMERNPDKVGTAWEKARSLPTMGGPTASELLGDEMGPYGFPRLNTAFFNLIVLPGPLEPTYDNTWFEKVLKSFRAEHGPDPGIGSMTSSANVAGTEPATFIL
ncbi:MAG TPA: hypothetical protein PKD45_15470 [Flavobacteriales bacterium]|nr:hypothetical protein [Flavobacteriales bacterium]